jgi:hypothetical protein
MENNTICNTISEMALRVAKEVDIAGYTGLGIHEETLSDLVLNRIRYEYADNFLTRKFTRKEEGSVTGADWLWCIGEPGSWITFAVQAKIVNIDTGRVNYLHYRKGEQHDLLINFCRQFRFIPKYSIYGKIDDQMDIFTMRLDDLKDIPAEQWAFSMISPLYIKNLKTPKEKHVSNVLKYSVPWSYVFCKKPGDNTSLAETISKNLERVYWIFEKEFRPKRHRKEQNDDSRINWENPLPSKFISEDIPLPVLYLLTKKSFSHKVPIPNVSIFSASPVQQVIEAEIKKIENRRQWKVFPGVFERLIWRIQDRNDRFLLP